VRGLAVVLTGTDLYRDIETRRQAQRSLELADALVVLQERGPLACPTALRASARVIYQSTTAEDSAKSQTRPACADGRPPARRERSRNALLPPPGCLPTDDIRIDHIGNALDPLLGEAATATMAARPTIAGWAVCHTRPRDDASSAPTC
jgi:hypothetical protein